VLRNGLLEHCCICSQCCGSHSCCFLCCAGRRLIAATYTPMVAVPLVHDPLISRRLLVRVWMTALGGAAKTWLWPNGPRFVSALTYVAMGWSCLPYLPLLTAAVDAHVVILVSVLAHCETCGRGMCAAGPWQRWHCCMQSVHRRLVDHVGVCCSWLLCWQWTSQVVYHQSSLYEARMFLVVCWSCSAQGLHYR
jgi:hypothetical protein